MMGEAAQPRGAYAISTIAYLASTYLSSVGFVILEFGELDPEKAGAIGTGVVLVALVPFLLVKMVMGVLRWDGPVAHAVGGAVSGVWGFALLLSHGEAAGLAVAAFFGSWGAFAGLIYWGARKLGQLVILGAET
jgi:hypothetical protein